MTDETSVGIDEQFFRRVDSTSNLPSQRSLLTSALQVSGCCAAQITDTSDQMRALQSPAWQNSESSKDDEPHEMKGCGVNIPRSGSMKIAGSMAHSPGTTRRHMLMTELSESVRRHMLWERRKTGNQERMINSKAQFYRRNTDMETYPSVDAVKDDFCGCSRTYHTSGW